MFDSRDLRELLSFAGVLGLGMAGLVIVLFCLVAPIEYASEYFSCRKLHNLTGVETDVSLSLGCMVKYEGRWVDPKVMTRNMQEVTVK